jgi:GGDEF domain-containing protein
MANQSHLNAEHTSVDCYLSTLSAIADCIGNICPEVGGLYGNRLNRHRARVAFDSSPQILEQSCIGVQAELKECAARAAEFLGQRVGALRSALVAQERNVRILAERQGFHATRLHQLAGTMGTTELPVDAEESRQILELQAAGLLSYADNMKAEIESLLARIQGELGLSERQIHEAGITDPITGLTNRREMERCIEARKVAHESPVLLQFHLTGAINDEVIRQVAAKLSAMFRPQDVVSRWSDTDFLVLFEGARGIAQARGERIVPWIAGRYLVDGEVIDIGVEVWLMHPELVAQAPSI